MKNLLVGDIGSTKSSWWITGPDREIKLKGYNPIVHTSDTGYEMLSALALNLDDIKPNKIWYYGAGVLDGTIANSISGMLASYFPKSKLYVKSDLEGAAISTCGTNPGTVAILGTGSHAAVYDGNNIIRQANSLGYILGDDGGGSDIGKSLLQAYFYHKMPEAIFNAMDKRLSKGRTGFLKELYASATPNQFLASFAEIAVTFHEDAWVIDLVKSRIQSFIKNILLPVQPESTVHFLGSIGCIFADLIETELVQHALQAGTFLKDPAYSLFTMIKANEIEE